MSRTQATFGAWKTPTGSNTKEGIRSYTVNDDLIYYGFSVPGALSTEARWCIQRHTTSGNNFLVEFAVTPGASQGSDQNNKIWNTDSVLTITGLTQANPGVVTVASTATLTTGDQIVIYDVGGMTEVNDLQFTLTVINGTTFSIGVNTTGYGAYTAGGSAFRGDFLQYTFT